MSFEQVIPTSTKPLAALLLITLLRRNIGLFDHAVAILVPYIGLFGIKINTGWTKYTLAYMAGCFKNILITCFI